MKNVFHFTSVLLLLITSSCAYNNKFLKPAKYNENTKSITIQKTKIDSTISVYNKPNYTPTFFKNGEDISSNQYTVEGVIFTNKNGNRLNGWMLKPKNIAITITVIHLHGNSGSILSQHKPMLELLKKGYQVFVFDYSGFGFSTGEATRKNLLIDGVAAVNYIKQRDDVKGTKLVLFGQSFGGHLASSVGAICNKDLDAVVIEGGFSNHKDLAAQGAKPFVAFMSRIFVKEFYKGTKDIKKITKPILIIHSADDTVIPYYMGEKLFKNAKSEKELFTIKGIHLDGLYKYLNEIDLKIKGMVR